MKLMGPLELLLCIFDVVIVDFVWTGERGRRGGGRSDSKEIYISNQF